MTVYLSTRTRIGLLLLAGLPLTVTAQGPVRIPPSTEKPNPTSGAIIGKAVVAVRGDSTAKDQGTGVWGRATGSKGVGVFGEGDAAAGGLGAGNVGAKGITSQAGGEGVRGVFVRKGPGPGAGFQDALQGTDPSDENRGSLGMDGAAVQGKAGLPGAKGVAGDANNGGNAVAIYGQSTNGFAGFFRGKVTVQGRLLVNRIDAEEIYSSKGLVGQGGAKFFKIDHPNDPANMYLYHASIESSELKNLYDGVVTLDSNGQASVALPPWFESLNTGFRYQLTPIGRHAPLYIAKEVSGGHFEIAGGQPGMKVSWQVTGVRDDAYARAHPISVEQAKAAHERGKYLNPLEHGFPESAGINYEPVRVSRLGASAR